MASHICHASFSLTEPSPCVIFDDMSHPLWTEPTILIDFLNDCLIPDPDGQIPLGEMRDLYRSWSASNDRGSLPTSLLSQALLHAGLTRDRTSDCRFWCGAVLRDPPLLATRFRGPPRLYKGPWPVSKAQALAWFVNMLEVTPGESVPLRDLAKIYWRCCLNNGLRPYAWTQQLKDRLDARGVPRQGKRYCVRLRGTA